MPWALAAAAVIFLIDLNTARGMAIGALYLVPVLIVSSMSQRKTVLAIAGVSSALVVLGWLLSPRGNLPPHVQWNRLISLAVVWAPALLAMRLAAARARYAREVEREHAATGEVQESVRQGLTNLLTLVEQVGRSGASAQEARVRLRARAQVMLTVLGMLSRSRGAPLELSAILRSMLPGSSADLLHIEGPAVQVPARQLQAVVLLFHELLSNGRAHGALSTDTGRIDVSWSAEALDGEPSQRVTLRWRESGGRAICTPPSPGFGTSVISGTVVHDLSGSVEFNYPESGCDHTLRFIIDSPRADGARASR